METLLGRSEDKLLSRFEKPQKKIFCIVGCARSGSTLLYQYLASTGYFAYPTNVISRFYYAPYIGARIQQLLFDYDYKKETFPEKDSTSYSSDYGKTFGPYEPHEFWYFWNRFFAFKTVQKLSKREIDNVDWETLLKELHALETVFDKPLLLKTMNLNWHILDLKSRIEDIHFIYIKRDILYNAQSLILARRKIYGNDKQWYSFKPPNYNSLKNLTAQEQVIEQVTVNNQAIEKQLKELDQANYTKVNYSDFCKNPYSLLSEINVRENLKTSILKTNFSDSNTLKLEKKEIESLKSIIALRKSHKDEF